MYINILKDLLLLLFQRWILVMTMQIVFILVIVVASESARYLLRAHLVSGPKLTQLNVFRLVG